MSAAFDQPKPSKAGDERDLSRPHGETVIAAVEGEPSTLEVELVSHSWQRSARVHQIDPDSREPTHILPESSLRRAREPIESVVLAAESELDRLHKIVGGAGYVTLFCDTGGVAIDHRGRDERSGQFRHWGIWLGGVWSEAAEGTNGIGTCIAEGRAVTVHQAQHFRTRHIGLSCSGAPVFDAATVGARSCPDTAPGCEFSASDRGTDLSRALRQGVDRFACAACRSTGFTACCRQKSACGRCRSLCSSAIQS
jgi:hypothetical protein